MILQILYRFFAGLASSRVLDPGPIRVTHRGRRAHMHADGTILPVVSGGDGDDTDPAGGGIASVADLRDERAQVLSAIDDIINTAREASRSVLEDDERERHDLLVLRAAVLEQEIARAVVVEGDAARFAAHDQRISAPNINVIGTPPPTASRSLDELFWSTAETVQAGSFGRNGTFLPNMAARASVEQVLVETDDGVLPAPRIDEFRPEHRQAIRSFQRTVADMCIFGLLVDKHAKSSSEGFEAARSHPLMAGRWRQAIRAMDVDTSGEGTEWVPTGIGADFHEKVRASGKVAPLFARVDIPTNPWKWPIEGADATAYRVPEPTSDTATKVAASTPGTAAPTFDAEIFGGRVIFSRSLEADSALAILPYATGKLVQAFVDAEETAILNGDTDGTHQDSDVGASTTDPRTAWDGLRKRGLANAGSAGGTAAATVAKVRAARALMGKWGLNPNDLVAISAIGPYYDLLGDPEVTSVEKYGAAATILNGELAKVAGVPLVVSEHIREDMNTSGVYDGSTTTCTSIVLVNRRQWAMGQRMAIDVEVDDSIYRETYQRVVVAFMREDFQNLGASTDDDTAVLYAIT